MLTTGQVSHRPAPQDKRRLSRQAPPQQEHHRGQARHGPVFTIRPKRPARAEPAADRRRPPFAIGRVLTVEPGLYISADTNGAGREYRGIGVRIEDDVLVTATGHEVLSAGIPKATAEIEEIRSRAS